ncbi:hypothetical protein [Streptomyces zaomyceticus]|uniref:hypothetical protein n=1 Tax=Streptomyces zaomyceticus TaxID=68286 RepID=UPI0036A038D6
MTEQARARRQESRSDAVPQPTFLQPEPRRQDSPDPDLTTLHPTADVPTQHRRTDDEAPAYATDSDGVKGDDRPMDGPSPASTADPKPVRVRPMLTSHQVAAGKALADAMLMAATAFMNRRSRVAEDDDRWLMTRQQRESVAAPLGRIVARRSPLPGGVEGNETDVADGVEAVVALVAYVIDQMTAERPSAPVYAPPDVEETPAPVGPGAALSVFDPAYRVG